MQALLSNLNGTPQTCPPDTSSSAPSMQLDAATLLQKARCHP